MQINDIILNADTETILAELRNTLHSQGIQYFQKNPVRSGNSLQIQCPYHSKGQEKRPSAGIRLTDGKFHCFACGVVHELPEVISYCFGHEEDMGLFGYSWLLRNFTAVEVAERKNVEIHLERDNFSSTCDILANRYNSKSECVTEEELDKYRYYHPYWEKRGIVDEYIIELFDLGYDKKTDCITFPVRDIDGTCLFLARRSVRTKYFKYPNGVEKPLYGLYELFRACEKVIGPSDDRLFTPPKEIIICESMIDALTCWQYGKYAVATNGTQVSELQFKQLADLPCRKLILAMDNDVAGRKGADRIRKRIKHKLITQYDYESYPDDAKDINDMTKSEFLALKEIF